MALTLGVVAVQARAQGPVPRIRGAVVSTNGEQVVGAQVRAIRSANQPTVTSDNGTFELFVLNDTAPTLIVRRIGFRPETLTVRLPQTSAPRLVVRMTRTIQMVPPVIVSATRGEQHSVLAAVRNRQRTGGNGHFAYREDFMKDNPPTFSEILRRIAGVKTVRTNRDFTEVRLRGSRCAPLYWIDGQPLLGIPFDPDLLPAQDIEALEVYSSAALVPPQFQGPRYAQGCGAIVIWTRQGERRVRRPKIDADSIVRLLDAHRIFVASEVDTPATILSIPEPEYPDSLRGAGVSGSAVIEFIVEPDGTLNKGSIGVVSATHIMFADAVRRAVQEATFTAAIKAQRAVAQVFQLPVSFTAPDTAPSPR